MDGGRWDSNQHQYRLTIVLKKIMSSFTRIYKHAFHDFLTFNDATISVDQFVDNLIRVGCAHDTFLFSKI